MTSLEAFTRVFPALPVDFKHNSFTTATAVTPTSCPSTYTANLKRDWTIGVVPHGGVLSAILANAARTHMTIQRANLNQPDLITSSQEYISACSVGPAEISVTELSLGRQYSTLRVQLHQLKSPNSPTRLLRIEAHIRQGNHNTESHSSGLCLPTIPFISSSKHGPPPPRHTCIEWQDPPEVFVRRTAFAKLIILISPTTSTSPTTIDPQLGPSVREQWITFRHPPDQATGFDIPALCYVADAFRPIPELYGVIGNWFPTLNMSVDVKKAPPPPPPRRKDNDAGGGGGGWKWLFMRIEAHSIQHGRMDLDVVILDQDGDLVALNRHVALVVPSERNLRRGLVESETKPKHYQEGEGQGSKL